MLVRGTGAQVTEPLTHLDPARIPRASLDGIDGRPRDSARSH
jgi:hypothetical protein